MGTWNYRICRRRIWGGDELVHLYEVREVHYDDAGKETTWTLKGATFQGDTPGEVMDALLRAAHSFSQGVFDTDDRVTVRLTHSGVPIKEKK